LVAIKREKKARRGALRWVGDAVNCSKKRGVKTMEAQHAPEGAGGVDPEAATCLQPVNYRAVVAMYPLKPPKTRRKAGGEKSPPPRTPDPNPFFHSGA